MGISKKLETIYHNGQPDGIRSIRRSLSTMTTYVIPRPLLSEAKNITGINRHGIYYLINESEDNRIAQIYIGQTRNGILRLDDHNRSKDFWNKAIMLLDNDVNIDRDVLDSLESTAIDYVDKHGSYETDNEYTPAPRMNPYKEQQVERLHNNILFRMRVLGYDLDRKEKTPVMVNAVFHTKKNGVQATGRYSQGTGRFTVLSGSEVDLVHPVIKNQGAVAARRHLFGTQTGKATLADDIELSSPSAAAVFVLGGSQNGWTEWVNEQGQTLDYVYRNKEHMNE